MAEISLPTANKQNTILTNIGNPNPTVADKTNVMNFLNKIHDTQLPKGGLKPVSFINDGGVSMEIGQQLEIVNITGSGFLKKSAFTARTLSSTTSALGRIIVTIDNSITCTFETYFTNSTNDTNLIGFFNQFDISTFTPTTNTQIVSNVGVLIRKIPNVTQYSGTSMSVTGAVNLNDSKIPFNESLKINILNRGIEKMYGYYDILAEVY